MEDNFVTLKVELQCGIKMAGISIVGTRDYQQDTHYCVEGKVGSLAVVCDGMGGMEQGELASRKAVELLVSDFENLETLENPAEFLYREAIKMDELVASMKDEKGKSIDAGTTVVAVLVVDNAAYWVSVGDSRIYIIRENEIFPVTRLHNYRLRLDEQLKNNQISQSKYEKEEAQAEALISYIGMNGLELVDCNKTPFGMQYLDKILLCSDGLYKILSEKEILNVVRRNWTDYQKIPEALIKSIQKSKKKHIDNTTVIVMSYE